MDSKVPRPRVGWQSSVSCCNFTETANALDEWDLVVTSRQRLAQLASDLIK